MIVRTTDLAMDYTVVCFYGRSFYHFVRAGREPKSHPLGVRVCFEISFADPRDWRHGIRCVSRVNTRRNARSSKQFRRTLISQQPLSALWHLLQKFVRRGRARPPRRAPGTKRRCFGGRRVPAAVRREGGEPPIGTEARFASHPRRAEAREALGAADGERRPAVLAARGAEGVVVRVVDQDGGGAVGREGTCVVAA